MISAALVWIATGFYSTILMAAMDPICTREQELVGANPLQVLVAYRAAADSRHGLCRCYNLDIIRTYSSFLPVALVSFCLLPRSGTRRSIPMPRPLPQQVSLATAQQQLQHFITLLLAGLLVAVIGRLS